MSFWDDFKDLFKTKDQLEEEKNKKLQDALKKEESVTNQLKQLEDLYNSTLEEEPDINELFPQESGLETIEYTPKTDEEITQLATDTYKGKYDKKKNDLTASSLEKENSLMTEASEKEAEKENELGELKSQRDSLYESAKNNAVKNGLSRSSIMNTQLEGVDNSYKAQTDNVKKIYDIEMDSISNQIEILLSEREAALEALDLQYAGDVKNKIDSLTEERDKLTKEYAEYNQKVLEKQKDYAIEREKQINDYLEEKAQQDKIKAEYEKEFGYSGEKKENYEQRYKIASDFYNSLSADIAVDALKASPTMKYYLGIYYDTLLDNLNNRKIGQKKYF